MTRRHVQYRHGGTKDTMTLKAQADAAMIRSAGHSLNNETEEAEAEYWKAEKLYQQSDAQAPKSQFDIHRANAQADRIREAAPQLLAALINCRAALRKIDGRTKQGEDLLCEIGGLSALSDADKAIKAAKLGEPCTAMTREEQVEEALKRC